MFTALTLCMALTTNSARPPRAPASRIRSVALNASNAVSS